MCFPQKSQKFVIFLGNMQEISALEANISSFQQISVKNLPFPHPDIRLMTKHAIWLKLKCTPPISIQKMLKLW